MTTIPMTNTTMMKVAIRMTQSIRPKFSFILIAELISWRLVDDPGLYPGTLTRKSEFLKPK